jgi:undecaprenyl diphosphate synthase
MATAAMPREVPSVLPRHVAIIMDGNGRWAAQRPIARAPPGIAPGLRRCARSRAPRARWGWRR